MSLIEDTRTAARNAAAAFDRGEEGVTKEMVSSLIDEYDRLSGSVVQLQKPERLSAFGRPNETGTSIPRQIGASVSDFAQNVGNVFSRAAEKSKQVRDMHSRGMNVESLSLPENLSPEQSQQVSQGVNANAFDAGRVLTTSGGRALQAEDPVTGGQELARKYGADAVIGAGVGGLATRGLSVPVRMAEQATNVLGVGGAIAGEKISPDNPLAPVVGGIAGTLALPTLAGTTRALMRGVGKNAAGFRDNVNVFNAAGTTPTVGQASEGSIRGAIARTIDGALDKLPISNSIWLKRFGVQNEEIRDSLIGRLQSQVLDRSKGTAGRIIRRGLQREGVNNPGSSAYQVVQGKYDDLARVVDPGTQGSFANTLEYIQNEVLPVTGMPDSSQTLGGSSEAFIRQLGEDIVADLGADGVATYQQLKEFRSRIGVRLSDVKYGDDIAARPLNAAYGRLTDDMRDIVRSTNDPSALSMFEDANQTYKQFLDEEADFLNAIMLKAEPEAVYRASTSNNSPEAVAAIYRRLKPEERIHVTAAHAERMGHATSSWQNDVGDVFSSQTFLTNWDKLNDSVKETLYPRSVYGSLREDMDSIAKTAFKIKDTAKGATNFSGTGQAILSGSSAIALTQAPLFVSLGLTGAAMSSSLLTSPSFTRWLAESTKVPLTSLPGYMARLTTDVAETLSHRELQDLQAFVEEVNSVFSDAGANGFVGARGSEPSNPLGVQQ